jgi:hypothetical protein
MRPPSDSTHQRLFELRNGLLRLHKALLESERALYERDIERINSRGHLLNLLLHDPWFAWLRELSQLVVLIDEMLDAEVPSEIIDATRLIAQARELLIPAENGKGFAKRYFEALQRDPNVVIAHSEMLKLFSRLAGDRGRIGSQETE